MSVLRGVKRTSIVNAGHRRACVHGHAASTMRYADLADTSTSLDDSRRLRPWGHRSAPAGRGSTSCLEQQMFTVPSHKGTRTITQRLIVCERICLVLLQLRSSIGDGLRGGLL